MYFLKKQGIYGKLVNCKLHNTINFKNIRKLANGIYYFN
ncbi:hypothetical protein H477_4329 [[Clostridium] sordellii ATCC 9714]|nr:hypothetical protein H477_4329 [[Clostridium] sordellii ATCC 9714] [Paeniclostridium sordellii ATCC 9714]EPZ56044.1 hypothetical protein H476_2645 [[Clostridium] sordellii VPI 9048] [Paeniclostridium sordellii VPI 9048]